MVHPIRVNILLKKGSFFKMKYKDKGNILGKMEEYMQENGLKIKCMEKEN